MGHFNQDGRAHRSSANSSVGVTIRSVHVPVPAAPPSTNLPLATAPQGGLRGSLPAPSHPEQTLACRATGPRPGTGSSVYSWEAGRALARHLLLPRSGSGAHPSGSCSQGCSRPCSSQALPREVAAVEHGARMALGAQARATGSHAAIQQNTLKVDGSSAATTGVLHHMWVSHVTLSHWIYFMCQQHLLSSPCKTKEANEMN